MIVSTRKHYTRSISAFRPSGPPLRRRLGPSSLLCRHAGFQLRRRDRTSPTGRAMLQHHMCTQRMLRTAQLLSSFPPLPAVSLISWLPPPDFPNRPSRGLHPRTPLRRAPPPACNACPAPAKAARRLTAGRSGGRTVRPLGAARRSAPGAWARCPSTDRKIQYATRSRPSPKRSNGGRSTPEAFA